MLSSVKAGKMMIFLAALTIFSFFMFGCETYGIRHSAVREVTGTVAGVTGPGTVYDMHVYGIMWGEPKKVLAGGRSDEKGGEGDSDERHFALYESTAPSLWLLFPDERVPDDIVGKTITLRYRVLIGENPPVVQVVSISFK